AQHSVHGQLPPQGFGEFWETPAVVVFTEGRAELLPQQDFPIDQINDAFGVRLQLGVATQVFLDGHRLALLPVAALLQAELLQQITHPVTPPTPAGRSPGPGPAAAACAARRPTPPAPRQSPASSCPRRAAQPGPVPGRSAAAGPWPATPRWPPAATGTRSSWQHWPRRQYHHP